MYEIVEHFHGATDIDPRHGFVRHVPQTETWSSSGATG